jgi:hypothetical protein
MPTGELSENLLVDLSSYILLYLERERKAGMYSLFSFVPQFSRERELLNFSWWHSIAGMRRAEELAELIEINRSELKEIVIRARTSDSPAQYLEYAQELTDQMKAATTLMETICLVT